MNLFRELDEEITSALEINHPGDVDMECTTDHTDKGKKKELLLEKLHRIVSLEDEAVEEPLDEKEASECSVSERSLKRRRYVLLKPSFGYNVYPVRRLSTANDNCKRLRLIESTGLSQESSTKAELLDLWWNVVDKHVLLTGGLPSLPKYIPSESKFRGAEPLRTKDRSKKRFPHAYDFITFLTYYIRNKSNRSGESLLSLMNRNITTLSRIRRTHSKFLVLNANAEHNNQAAPVSGELPSDVDADEEPTIHESGWKVKGEVDQRSADDCLRWMTGKILQHAGFQGGSFPIACLLIAFNVTYDAGSATSALNVLMSVASEYLQNVGRTIRFLCDRYSHKMSPEVSFFL